MLRFRLFGIPFAILPAFWIGSALLGGNLAQGQDAVTLLLVWVVCVFVSITVHELGHALTARHFGAEPAVELQMFGGVTRMFGRTVTRAQSFWVTLAGPAAGFTLYLVAWMVSLWFSQAGLPAALAGGGTATVVTVQTLTYLCRINLVWTLFNLLPILPLDGGRMLSALLGPQRLGATLNVGVFTAGAAATLAWVRFGQWPAALFLAYLAFVNFRHNPRIVPGGVSQ